MVGIRILVFNCYKIASRLPLERIEAFFKVSRESNWKDYIILEGDHLGMILKYETADKYAYIFRFGCIAFFNFNDYETRVFLQYIESIAGKVDYYLFSKFNETHTIQVDDNGQVILLGDDARPLMCDEYGPGKAHIIHLVALVLAKSTELHKIETEMSLLLDEAEKFIFYLYKGKLGTKNRKLTAVVAKILRFEYESIWNVRNIERFAEDEHSIQLRKTYDALVKYYEMQDRLDVVRGKISELRNITRTYTTLSFKSSENRLYWFEVFLLALFPIVQAAHYLLGNFNIHNMFKQLYIIVK